MKEGVQSNKYKLEGNDLYIFNVYNISERKYLNDKECDKFCESLELKRVPFIKYDTLLGTVEDWVEFSKGQSLICKGVQMEGIVVRGIEEETISDYGRFSFKVINPDFLLRYSE